MQQQIALALDRAAPGPPRLLSLRAGRGRDVLLVLATHPRGRDMRGRLVELDPELSAAARAGRAAVDRGAEGRRRRAPARRRPTCCCCAGSSAPCRLRTSRARWRWSASLLATGGTVVWTRNRRAPDLTPRVRAWFAAAGVAETAFVAAPGPGCAVGAGVLQMPGAPLIGTGRLFTFTAWPS